MALTTFAGIVAGKLKFQYPITKNNSALTSYSPSTFCRTSWEYYGYPIVGTYNSTLDGVTLSANSGGVQFPNPASGETRITGFRGVYGSSPTTFGPFVIIADRLWHNGGISITSTSPQSIASPTWPARDDNGSTNGRGVYLGVEVSSSCGAATPTITVSYTNSDGTSGRTATNIYSTQSSAPRTSFYPLNLQAGDVGVKSVESITLSASWVSGTINLVAYRAIGAIGPPDRTTSKTITEDAVRIGFGKVYDDAVLYFWSGANANSGYAARIFGELDFAQG